MQPYSGAIFEIVPLSPTDKFFTPDPKNSTNDPTTLFLLNNSVIVKTKSVAVTPSCKFPDNFTPTTSGKEKETDLPKIATYASILPTPQPKTPIALTMGV